MIGFDIGGTKCAVSVGVEENGTLKIQEKRAFPTDHSLSPYEIIDRMCTLAEEMTDDFSRIGISCGGPLDSRRGIIQSPPNLPGWDDVKIVDYLKEKYGGKVGLQNDANACALAEWRYGAGRGTENMVFLTFGSGLGAGLILNGQLYSGTNDMAGEIGHVRLEPFGPVGYGKAGSAEGFCSGGGIAQIGRYKAMERFQMGGSVAYCSGPDALDGITAKAIAEAAAAGDALAAEVYRICGEKLGRILAILMDLLNPEAIVLGSIYGRAQNLLETELNRVLEAEALPHARRVCRILPAGLGEQIGDFAALAVAGGLR